MRRSLTLRNVYSEWLMLRSGRKQVSIRSVEARLYLCCAAGIGFPVSMFLFAWLSYPFVHWALLCLALVVRGNGCLPTSAKD